MIRILILDDHAGFRKLLRIHFSAKWPSATIVESDPEAEGRGPSDYAAADYDLVLLDFQLGRLNGFDYLRHFRTLPDFPPVIMLTGEGNERLAVEAIKLGAADYIPKQQMTHDILVRAAQDALDARGALVRHEQGLATPVSVPERVVQVKGLKLEQKLAEGGMSTIYLARRESGGEPVVLKVSDLASAGEGHTIATQRFAVEYEILRRLSHPHIVRVFEQGFSEDYAYISMEYFPGGSLRQVLREPLPPQRACAIAADIASALHAVHELGVMHRDLKPNNIMFRADGSVALIDFGVAKSLDEPLDLTRAGLIVGTPHYLSPEQVDGGAPDARSDLYSLGVLLYEMMTGYVPYTARTALAVMYKHRHAPVPQLPPELSRWQPLISRLLEKAPEDRMQTAAEAADFCRGMSTVKV